MNLYYPEPNTSSSSNSSNDQPTTKARRNKFYHYRPERKDEYPSPVNSRATYAEQQSSNNYNGYVSPQSNGPSKLYYPQAVKHPQGKAQNGGDKASMANSQNRLSPFLPSGRKMALLVGINYKGSSCELKGCVRDVEYLHHMLTTRFGFRNENIIVLVDEEVCIPGAIFARPTRDNILVCLAFLVAESQPGDSLWFSFSGHGGQIDDENGDESDGLDEILVPVDFEINGFIVDDDLHQIVTAISPGARLTAFVDACHSGAFSKSFDYSALLHVYNF